MSRRYLAASGLDVSAPEFVPSFAARPAQPLSPPVAVSPPLAASPQTTVSPPLAASPPFFDTASSHPHQQLFHPPHISPHGVAHVQNNYYDEDQGYTAQNAYYSSTSPQRPPHLDEATYVTAVQHFDEEFPALAKPQLNASKPLPQRNQSAPFANAQAAAPRWTPDRVSTPTRQPNSQGMQSIFPKALGWNALQREEARKQRDADAARQWHAALEEYTAELDAEYDELYESEEPRLTSDIGSLWVTTGQSVGQLYQALRAEAAEEARLRNKYFDRAAAAFKRNDGASAKRLGALGREANERMKELHKRAAEAIFEARNPPNVTDVVDLHGLHVSEALERLPAALEKAPPGTLRILTGTGHHTKGTGRARLRPAVKKWLQDNEYFFEEVIDANEYVGSFKVEIAR